ncbi:MAG: hypothetical protein GF401_14350 [Chitinivibrionales bacterium]|nr:hypothetical protein [Chitinivibrionales bacterium]
MVRINLLKEVSRKTKKEFHVSPKMVIFGSSGIGLVLVISLVVFFVRNRPVSQAPEEKQVVSEHTPSSFAQSDIIEDVVKDIHDNKDLQQRSGYIDLPYEQLSFAGKLNYEALFAKNVCDMLIRTIPEEIGLRSLEVENFQTIYALGFSSSKVLIDELFTSLKEEEIELLPKPLTFIRPNKGSGYRFAFTCEAGWGLHTADPFVDLSLSNLPLRSTLNSSLKKFKQSAGKSSLEFTRNLSKIDAEKIGDCRRFTYEFSGKSSFANFVKFLENLYDARIHCAFKKITLVAKNRNEVAIDAEVIFTTMD